MLLFVIVLGLDVVILVMSKGIAAYVCGEDKQVRRSQDVFEY